MNLMPFARFKLRLLPALLSSAVLLATCSANAVDLQPNEHLSASGIPAIDQAIAERASQYNDFRPRAMLDWHPKQRWMLISTRTKGATAQLHLLRKAQGELEQLTDYPDSVRRARFEPKTGQYIVFEKDDGGNEANQLYRLDLPTSKDAKAVVTLLTDPNEKHASGPWNHHGDRILLGSIGLDKTASGGKRAEINTDLSILDPKQPQAKRKLISLPGGGWEHFEWSHDDKTIVAINAKSINDSNVWLIDVASGKASQILPAAGAQGQPVHYDHAHFSQDGKSLIMTSDAAGEFLQLVKYDLASKKTTPWSGHINWDVSNLSFAPKDSLLAANVNREGLSELHLFSPKTGKEVKLPAALPAGAVGRPLWQNNGTEIAFSLNNAQSPGEVVSLDVKSGKLEQWTTPHPTGVDTSKFPAAEIIRWNSFDQRAISGLIARPPKDKFKGPRPVLISIHGGPEAQANIGFLGRSNYLLNELGITLIQPNVRGSSGFGKSFLKLDDGMLREDSVKDIGALLDWIATQPDLDAKHVMVSGGSYGGYMSLAVSTTYADRIVGAIDTVGISHFVTFLERTETYRRDLRRVEYGDERQPEMRAFMEKISPLNNAQKITKPLFVIQGKNDPRVPVYEAEQIVAKVKQNNTPVWYLVADNEGHGFQKKNNADFAFFSQIRFMEEFLLK